MQIPLFSHYSGVEVHERGYWIGPDAIHHHAFDKVFSRAIVAFLKKEGAGTVADFGCGEGSYVKLIAESDILCDGFDGNPHTKELTGGRGKVLDLSKPFSLEKVYDWIICIEVGEHIPKKFEKTFFENVHKHNKNGVILSWAVKGQGGWGHFNEQDNQYVKNKMAALGYVNDIEAEKKLRLETTLFWLKDTVMVFRKS